LVAQLTNGGRGRLLPIGLGLSSISAAFLLADLPIVAAALVATALSLGYDMTQPMLAGIVTTLGGKRPGQAMGLNVFTLLSASGLVVSSSVKSFVSGFPPL